MAMTEIQDFKKRLSEVDAKFQKIDKKKHSLDNIRKAQARNLGNHFGLVTDGWLPCCRPGIPCTSRIMTIVESSLTDNCKVLVTACGEIKYCLHSTR